MLRRLMTGLLAGAFVLTLGLPAAFAQEDPEGEQVFDFEGDTIEEEFLKPHGAVIGAVLQGDHDSLIKLRVDFVDEIVRSAEDI